MGPPPKGINEVIEIGAYKINEYGEQLGKFERFVKPSANPILSGFCKKLTSITQDDVDNAMGFKSVINDFKDWCGVFKEDYHLCSWGDNDELLLTLNCKWHKMEYDWLENHMDVKQQYFDNRGEDRHRGLKVIVNREGFEFTGKQHRAISDAENLAKIFVRYIDEWIYD